MSKMLAEIRRIVYEDISNRVTQYDESEKAIEMLVKEGIKSIGWNLDKNVEVAIENGHPNPKKLKELAERITKLED